MEGVTPLEIVHRIRFGFPKNPRSDKIEHHIAKVFAPPHSPKMEDRRHHRAVLLQRVLPDAFQELLPGDVRIGFQRFLPGFDCEIERVAKEVISLAIEAGVLLDDVLKFFTKIKFLHILERSRGDSSKHRWRSAFRRITWGQAAAMNHALKLPGHANRDLRKRQLQALLAAAFLAAQVPGARSQAPAAAEGELRAARLMELSLAAKNADAEAWSKLDMVYAQMDAKYPNDMAVQNGRAQYLWDRGEKQLAMEKWEAVTKTDPKNSPALSSLANVYLASGEIKQAAACFTRASDSAPANASYHFDLANVVFLFRHDLLDATAPEESKLIQRALNHFAEAARLEPLNVEYAKAYGDVFYYLQPPDWTSALTAWNHYLEITPHKDFAHINLARVHLSLGQKEEARADLSQVKGPEFDPLKARLNQRIDAQ